MVGSEGIGVGGGGKLGWLKLYTVCVDIIHRSPSCGTSTVNLLIVSLCL